MFHIPMSSPMITKEAEPPAGPTRCQKGAQRALGEDRLAARASVWIFHEAAQRQANGQQEADLWQTGGDLISAKSGIIMHSLGDRTERALEPPPDDADRGRWPAFDNKLPADMF